MPKALVRVSWLVVCFCLLGLLLISPVSATAKKLAPITGKLSKPGYTLIALADGGKASSVRVRHAKFKLRPPAKLVTLHLRAPNGVYAGPVVVGQAKQGKRAIVGVRAGAKLGQVKIKSGKGYAKLQKKLAKKWLDAKRTATAKKGVPIGAGNLGLVRVKKLKGPKADRDLDGVPASLDIDDDGDLILDAYDRSSGASASGAGISQAAPPGATWPGGTHIQLATSLSPLTSLGQVNVDGGSTDEQIAALQQSAGALYVLSIGLDPGSGELDCGTLVYCSRGGTGRWMPPTVDPNDPRGPSSSPFPECCDPDGDGLGSLMSSVTFPDGASLMAISHGATPEQIKAGDVLIERGTANGEPQESASSVGFIFATHPVLAAYDDGQGDSATFSYPRPEACRITPGSCAAPVRAGPNGLVVKMTFWRPQRPRLEGDPGSGEWMDVGNLAYAVGVARPTGGAAWCPQGSYPETDQNLTPLPAGVPLPNFVPSEAAFADASGDQPSNPANTFTNTLNLSQCYASAGLSMPTGIQLWIYAAPVDSDPMSPPNAFATSQAQFIVQP